MKLDVLFAVRRMSAECGTHLNLNGQVWPHSDGFGLYFFYDLWGKHLAPKA
jgi:hypothetical protein